MSDNRSFLGQIVHIQIDRPLGSTHPKHENIVYPINYGFVPDTLAGDGEPIDAYILGVPEPLTTFEGQCIAIIHRLNDNEDKLIVAPQGVSFTPEEIREAVDFQEKFFRSEIII